MKRLYVQPAYRKFKIGEALVDAILLAAVDRDYQVMKLDTLEKLQSAIQLYLKKGFTITNAYYQNPLPNVVYMEKWMA
jgi:GNAT superfamily N-acetyltransferase